jgi:NADPH:quinone reductase-like Zn-dependent oxidoreductase
VLKPGGILLSTVQPPSQEIALAHGVRQKMIGTAPPVRKVLTEAAQMVEAGQLKPYVSEVLPLQDIAKAHEMIEGRHTRGKIVLQVVQ